ncbi:MAG TPA: NTP transferase domain-containing protein [Solirubrobacteraceae bacterium]|nr:NTP transferase domain-containing protein [Solirubrobacteraceae bacterium]
MTVVSSVSLEPVGVVLAGGLGRRLGGAKGSAELFGRPLAAWVADALGEVVSEVVIAVKERVEVPALSGVAVWREPSQPVHPLAGIAWALSRVGEARDIVVCAVDLPFCVDAVRAVVAAARAGAGREAAVVMAEGQPLLGVYRGSVAGALQAAVEAGRPARAVVAELGALVVPVPDPGRTLFNVNTVEDLARAEAMVCGG